MNKILAEDLSDKEIFPIVDTQGKIIGKATRRQCHSGSRLLHPVVHLHVFNDKGEIFLQKRSLHKFIQPGKWDTAVGGHVDYGENVEQALRREAGEEIGLSDFTPHAMLHYVYDSKTERELVNTFYTITTVKNFKLNHDEVDDGRYWNIQEVKEVVGRGVLTPNFEEEFNMMLNRLNFLK